jgi:hypothetical protein
MIFAYLFKQFSAICRTRTFSDVLIEQHESSPYLFIIILSLISGRAMAQVVSRRLVSAKARVRAEVNQSGICGGIRDTGTGQASLRVFQFLLSVSFHRGSPCSHITWGLDSRPVGGRSSETEHPIDVNKKKLNIKGQFAKMISALNSF